MAEDNESPATTGVDEVIELLFLLSISRSKERYKVSEPSSTLLIYFSGVLVFSPDSKTFSLAKTSHQPYQDCYTCREYCSYTTANLGISPALHFRNTTHFQSLHAI